MSKPIVIRSAELLDIDGITLSLEEKVAGHCKVDRTHEPLLPTLD